MTGMTLSDLQKSALSEIGNIGAGNASTSLAMMTNHICNLAVPETRIMDFADFASVRRGHVEEPMVAAYVAFEGDAKGCLLLMLSARQSSVLFDILGLPHQEDILELPELHRSAVSELGNIITSSYLNALSMFTGLTLLPEPPGVAAGMTGAILDTIGAHLGQYEQFGIVVHVHIYSGSDGVRPETGVELLMVPQRDSLRTILSALGVDEQPEQTQALAGA